jgi:hypothetical protein
VLDKALIGWKMRWSGATTAGSKVRVAAEFVGIDGHRGTFLSGFSVGDLAGKLNSISKPTLIQFGSNLVRIS